ncbi:sugar transferase [soil metagenome]
MRVLQRGLALKFKRIVDLSVASAAGLVVAPVVALAALAVVLTDGRPAFFAQDRPGKGGKPFRFFKLRTMKNAKEKEGKPEFDGDRMTTVGRVLRATSIDELPQLLNVIRGEMSLVGPRPLLMHYLPRYSASQARRHEVLPGITGWAQINGRNSLSWDEKFALDVWYVDKWTPLLDLQILARTMGKVVKRDGIGSGGPVVTMPEFMGSAE